MKKVLLYITCIGVLFTSCIKQLEKKYTGKTVVELDAALLNSNAVGLTYPVLTRVVPEGRQISTSVDSTLRRFAKNVRLRINLVGPQSAKEETVGYKIFSSPITTIAFPATISGQTPTRASATLNISNAVAGTHYTTLNGTATIPANSSFGYITVQVIDGGSTAGQGQFLGIQLDSSGTVLPNPNYNKIGLVIDQR